MTRTLTAAIAWLALAAIIFVTISPIGWRPHDVLPVNLDRALAFMFMGFVFTLAYPQHWRVIALLVVLSAFPIEYLQYFSPTRHPHILDASFKAFGALLGVSLGRLMREPVAALVKLPWRPR